MSGPTIPELRADQSRAADDLLALASAARAGEKAVAGLYTASLRFNLASSALEAAEWRLAVESHRSVKRWEEDRRWGDEHWWHIWRGVLALRWAVSGRQGPPPGFLPSREVAVRAPAPLACLKAL